MKTIFTSFLILFTAVTIKAQHTLVVSGQVSNNNNQPIMVILDFSDSLSRYIDTVWTDSSGFYLDSFSVPLAGPASVGYAVASITDCNGVSVYTSATYSSNVMSLTMNLNYCGSNPPTPCQALFSKSQAYDSLRNPIPGHVVITDRSTGSNLQYFWDFGDSTTSTLKNPVHSYAGNGPYILCLTVTDSNCTDTYCDTVRVDTNGMLKSAAGFTIYVGDFTLGIQDNSVLSFKMWPVPATNTLNLQFDSNNEGSAIIQILGINGQSHYDNVLNIQGISQLEIDIHTLPSGMYLLQVRQGEEHFSKRFIKK